MRKGTIYFLIRILCFILSCYGQDRNRIVQKCTWYSGQPKLRSGYGNKANKTNGLKAPNDTKSIVNFESVFLYTTLKLMKTLQQVFRLLFLRNLCREMPALQLPRQGFLYPCILILEYSLCCTRERL